MKRSSARVRVTELQNCTLIKVEGEINESFDPDKIAGRRGVVVFDMGGVRRITSHGVLQWITALRSLEANYYCFINCRPCTMDQFNLVQAFRQEGEVVSFYATFTCTDCGKELEHLIDLRHYFQILETLDLPEVSCAKCGAATEFDEVPELYFKYVLSAPPPRPPPAANAAIGGDQTTAPRGRRFQMEKEVEQSLTVFWLSGYLDQSTYFKRMADGVDGLALLELAELEGVSEGAMAGLREFLARVGERALLARVPAPLLSPVAGLLEGGLGISVVSFLVPFRCTGCQAVFGGDIWGDRIASLATSTGRAELCPRCMHPLESQWSPAAVEAANRLPTAAAPPVVQDYLRARPPSGRLVAGDRLAGPTDPSRLVLDKYQVVQPIGKGGMGEVFLARQQGPEGFEKLVVLKRIRRDQIGSAQSRELFLREARIAARLSHPNIVQIFDLERQGDEYLISMEYVNGIDLARALQLSREARLIWPVEICCHVISELCSALHAAHSNQDEEGRSAPIIHRDVSPSNILLSTEGAVKLADFGIAGAVGDPSQSEPRHGKPGYAAPEQCAGASGVTDERTDIYAAGVVLYECLTLRPISLGPTLPPTAPPPSWRPHSPPQICVARSGAPPLLQDVFERAIQPDPALRYRTARELGRDLERIGRMVSETSTESLGLWVRRLLALRLEADGVGPDQAFAMHTGSGATGPVRRPRTTLAEFGRK